MARKVVISTSSFGEHDKTSVDLLKEARMEIVFNPFGRKLKEEEIKTLLDGAEYLIAGTEPLTREVLASAKSLKIISRCGTGLDNVDLAAASELGIKVFNTPDAPALAVAELTVGLIFSLLRKIPAMDKDIKGGAWNKRMGNLICGKKVGVIGMGRIGRKVATYVSSMGAVVSYTDIHDCECEWPRQEKRELLEWADIVTLHCTGGKCGYVIGNDEISWMKKTAFIINTSRGGLIDEIALEAALRKGDIAGAALDVFGEEPYVGGLIEQENTVLTSHAGSYALEARVFMEKEAVVNLLRNIKSEG